MIGETKKDWLCAFSQWKKLSCELGAFLLIRTSSDFILHRRNNTSLRKLLSKYKIILARLVLYHTGAWLPPNLILHPLTPGNDKRQELFQELQGICSTPTALFDTHPNNEALVQPGSLDPALEPQPKPAGLHMLMKTSCFVLFCLRFLLLVVVCLFSFKEGHRDPLFFAMTPLDFAASEQVIIFVPSKNLSCCVGRQGNLAIPSPLPGVSQRLKCSNSTQVSDSPWHEAFQQVRVPLGWIQCELLGGSQCVYPRMGWGTAGTQHTLVSPHRSEQWHTSDVLLFLLGIIIIVIINSFF